MWSKRLPVGTDGTLRFFFYGTLIGGGPLEVRQAVGRLRDLGPAQLSGLLYAIPDPGGWYPALVKGEGAVAGRVYEATGEFRESDLAVLDAYEDFDPADPAGSLYRRTAIGGVQAYRFNQPVPEDAIPITGGDFLAWLAERGEAAFGA